MGAVEVSVLERGSQLAAVLIVVGVLFRWVNGYIPMPGTMPRIHLEHRQGPSAGQENKPRVTRLKQQIAQDVQRRAHKFAAMEATPMKVVGVISAAALFLLLGITVPAFGQGERQQEAKPEAKPAGHEAEAKPAKQQEQAKPEKQQVAKPARPENETKSAKKEPAAKPAKPENETKSAQKEPAAKPARPENETKSAKKEPAAKPAKQENEARSAKKEPAAKPVRQENEARSAKKEPAAKPARQENEARSARKEPAAKPEERSNNAGRQHAQRTPAEEQRQREVPALRLSSRGSGRIPDDRYRDHFGEGHTFVINDPVMVGGFSRFQYGGYWFGFNNPWPEGWYYTDDVYVDYIDGGYYLCNPYYPGARVGISVVI
jgi:hypothetical protein